MLKLPAWMRVALLATALMNVLGSLVFLPPADDLRQSLGGFPAGGHPIYPATVAVFIFIFGLAYLRTGIRGYTDRLFITMAATGKLAFFGLTLWYWQAGTLPFKAPASTVGDLIFSLLFFLWLFRTRSARPSSPEEPS